MSVFNYLKVVIQDKKDIYDMANIAIKTQQHTPFSQEKNEKC